MLASDVFDSKIIHNEDKGYWSPFVSPESWSGGALIVSLRFQSFGEEVISQFASLLEAVYALGDLKVHPSFVLEFCKVVFCVELIRDVRDSNAYIFWAIQRCAQVEVF